MTTSPVESESAKRRRSLGLLAVGFFGAAGCFFLAAARMGSPKPGLFALAAFNSTMGIVTLARRRRIAVRQTAESDEGQQASDDDHQQGSS